MGQFVAPLVKDSAARLLIVGLAPAAHGGNRTGRIFTGDESGNFLFRALHSVGLSNQAESVRDVIDNETGSGDAPGLVVQFGGQTAINLAEPLARAGGRILGGEVPARDVPPARMMASIFCSMLWSTCVSASPTLVRWS